MNEFGSFTQYFVYDRFQNKYDEHIDIESDESKYLYVSDTRERILFVSLIVLLVVIVNKFRLDIILGVFLNSGAIGFAIIL